MNIWLSQENCKCSYNLYRADQAHINITSTNITNKLSVKFQIVNQVVFTVTAPKRKENSNPFPYKSNTIFQLLPQLALKEKADSPEMICGVEDQEEQERAVQMRQETGGQRAAMHGHRRRCRIIPIRRRSAADSLDIQPDDERSEVERVEREIREGQTTSGKLRGARATRLDHPLDEDDGRRRDLIGRPDLCRQVQNDRKGVVPPTLERVCLSLRRGIV
ncbi:hypothetical protein TNCT_292691 [Trichonephila clavata]|uniref:Uncharacterized protein n=1 Tax=Trichonephila clavata TaxID=2740835 RepID=A0A8X6LLJ8_TRICU|nr:hypothetical protein TNCT_292691 [Trichonephila clavata]